MDGKLCDAYVKEKEEAKQVYIAARQLGKTADHVAMRRCFELLCIIRSTVVVGHPQNTVVCLQEGSTICFCMNIVYDLLVEVADVSPASVVSFLRSQ